MTPTPTPAPEPIPFEGTGSFLESPVFLEIVGIVTVILTFAAVVGVAWFLVRSLLKAAAFPGNTVLVVSLSLLTLVALILIAVVSAENVSAIVGLAGVGLGALAGAVQSQYGKDKDNGSTQESPPASDTEDSNGDSATD